MISKGPLPLIRIGDFEKVARVLHISPPAVSRRVKQLEAQTGAVGGCIETIGAFFQDAGEENP